MSKKLVYAKDYKCVKCGKQANVFFGLADPDAEQLPLCQKCANKTKKRIFKKSDDCLVEALRGTYFPAQLKVKP